MKSLPKRSRQRDLVIERLSYPGNLQSLDLATMVHLFRNRGEPRRAAGGDYFFCVNSLDLVKEARNWFGVHIGIQAWDRMMTPHSNGYPLTAVEIRLLGSIRYCEGQCRPRSDLESEAEVHPQLLSLIIRDLIQFGFLTDEDSLLRVSADGERALHGYSRHYFGKTYYPGLLDEDETLPVRSSRGGGSEQPNLF